MSEVILEATIRTNAGKASSLRRAGTVPGVFYGHGMKNISVAVPEMTLRPLYATTLTHVINLKLNDGSAYSCILKDIDFDPVTERPIHFDLLGLNPDEEVSIDVPVTLTGGIPQGVRDGGILQHVLHKIHVMCLPKHIPEHVEVDVAGLLMNKSIHVSELIVQNVRVLDDPRSTVVAVVPPVIEKAPEVAVAETAEGAVAPAAPAEPEVIARGKKVEEGAAEEKE